MIANLLNLIELVRFDMTVKIKLNINSGSSILVNTVEIVPLSNAIAGWYTETEVVPPKAVSTVSKIGKVISIWFLIVVIVFVVKEIIWITEEQTTTIIAP